MISATVMNARYCNRAAAWRTASGAGGDRLSISARSGIVDSTASTGTVTVSSRCRYVTSCTRWPSCERPHSVAPSSTSCPPSSSRCWKASHIMPGPKRGYSNSSISDLTGALPLRRKRLKSMSVTAVHSDSDWMRCAAHCAPISVHGMPQTFSV